MFLGPRGVFVIMICYNWHLTRPKNNIVNFLKITFSLVIFSLPPVQSTLHGYNFSRCLVECPTVSRCLVECPTVSRCLVECPTVSRCLVECPTVSRCLVECPTVSRCLVECPTVLCPALSKYQK